MVVSRLGALTAQWWQGLGRGTSLARAVRRGTVRGRRMLLGGAAWRVVSAGTTGATREGVGLAGAEPAAPSGCRRPQHPRLSVRRPRQAHRDSNSYNTARSSRTPHAPTPKVTPAWAGRPPSLRWRHLRRRSRLPRCGTKAASRHLPRPAPPPTCLPDHTSATLWRCTPDRSIEQLSRQVLGGCSMGDGGRSMGSPPWRRCVRLLLQLTARGS